MEPNDFNKLFYDIVKPAKKVDKIYKLYYNKKTGKPLQYSTENLDGDFIVINKQQYAESRYDSIVVNGKLTTINEAVQWAKLIPSTEGTACAVDNVMIVDNNSQSKWKLKVFLAD